MTNQVKASINTNNFDEEHQPAFRYMHSTETAPLNKLGCYGAFDTVDYRILFDGLVRRFGDLGCGPEEVKSYLHSWIQLNASLNHGPDISFRCGPQRPVLMPLLFVLCILHHPSIWLNSTQLC